MDEINEAVEGMIKKAESANKADDALKFSQAACNAANALFVLKRLGQAKDLNRTDYLSKK